MRLRTFTGRSTTEAMAAVRAALGPNAVIVSAQDDGNGSTRVTAALDERDNGPDIPAVDTVLGEALEFHGASPVMRAWIVGNALQSALDTPAEALASGLGHSFRFAPITAQDRAILLVGPPGTGKTVTAAKIATRDVLAGKRVRLVS